MVGISWSRGVAKTSRCARYTHPQQLRSCAFRRAYASRTTAEESTANAIGRPLGYVGKIAYWSTALFLSGHIFWTYFYSISPTYGISMLPTIQSSGDAVLISKYYRRGRGVGVGDVVSKMDEMGKRLDNIEAAIQAHKQDTNSTA